jgi:hypothetical protein
MNNPSLDKLRVQRNALSGAVHGRSFGLLLLVGAELLNSIAPQPIQNAKRRADLLRRLLLFQFLCTLKGS